MSKASDSELAALHGALATELKSIITSGAEIQTKEGTARVTAPAAYFGAAVAFLKNNNITSDPATDEGLTGLADALQRKRQDRKKELSSFADAADAFGEQLGAGFPGSLN